MTVANAGDLQALKIGEQIDRVVAEQPVAVERKPGDEILQALPAGGQVEQRQIRRLRDRRLRQADLEHDGEGHKEEQYEPGIGNEQHQPLAQSARAGRLAAHALSTTPACAGHATQTASPAAKAGRPVAPFVMATLIGDPSASRNL